MKQRSLRVAMFFSSDPSAAGGVQEQLLFLSKALEKRGHAIDIFGPWGNKFPFHSYTEVSKPTSVLLPNGNQANITISIPTTKAALTRIVQTNYDLIHIHEPYIPFVAWDLIRQVEGKPLVSTFHTAWNDTSILRGLDSTFSLLQELYSKHFLGSMYVSHLTAKRWHGLVKPGNGHLERVITLGIDNRFKPSRKEDALRQTRLSNRAPRLLFVGRLVTRKGAHFLLESFRKMLNKVPDATLTIVGDGERREYLESLAQELELRGKVSFVGELMGKKRIGYFQEADIFCAPYTDEAFGLTIVEAMACGCPIVGFDNHAFDDSLSGYPERSKLLVPYKDIASLTDAMVMISTNKSLYQKLRRWCLNQSKRFSWAENAKQTEQFYFDVLSLAE